MNKYLMRFFKYISILLVFVTLSCSFGETKNDSNALHFIDNETSQREKKIAGTLDATEIISSGEVFSPSLQALLIKRLSSGKHGGFANEMQVLVDNITLTFSIAFLAFLTLCLSAFCDSHRFILRYIHSMDGKKA